VNEGRINLRHPDGGTVELGVKGADRPDSLRGVGLFDVVLDEFADMKPETWEQIIRPALADVKGTALFIGTPKGRNHFYDIAMKAVPPGADFPYRGAAPIHGDWQAFHYTTYDNPFIAAEEIEQARMAMSAQAFRQEFLASFETGTGDVFLREHLKYGPEPRKDPNDPTSPLVEGDWFVAVDLAGFGDPKQGSAETKFNRRDKTAIAVVKILEDGRWWVRDIISGRWGVEETAKRVVDAVASCETLQLGIEKGSLYNAVSPYLVNEAAKRRIAIRPKPLSHENQSKANRIAWALQGHAEHGRIILREGAWNREFEDQWINFPSKMVHDDMLDALAFITQLAENRVFSGFGAVTDEPYWEPQDEIGY
jgi:predicted phage terminase large subunit-like protein